jgi:23S rRNA (uridine2552-2'-O)-methyltransferase
VNESFAFSFLAFFRKKIYTPVSECGRFKMAFNPQDHYFKKAKKENFAARSVYKLEEIDKRYRLFHPKNKVLDLGASPGSWSQYVSQKVGAEGRVLGVDLKPVDVKLANATFIQADLRDLELRKIFEDKGFLPPFDSVISDMAPATTGIRITDQARSLELCDLALEIALEFLKPKGHFVCKLFHSDDFQTLKKKVTDRFERFEAVKPEATRAISKEIFLVGLRKKT